MTRPNLVNPNNWSPFKSIPTIEPIQTQILPPPPPPPPPPPLSRRELIQRNIQRNSFILNFIGMIIIGCIVYFLYSIYLERKILSDYIIYVKNQGQDQNQYRNYENYQSGI